MNNLYVARAMHDFQEQYNVKFTDSEVRTWLLDSLYRPSKKLRNCLKIKIQKILKDRQKWRRNCSTNTFNNKEKNIQDPHDKKELAQVLKSYYVDNAIMRLSSFSLKQCIM